MTYRKVVGQTKVLILYSCAFAATLAPAARVQAATVTIVNDSWADGGRDNGADPLDSNWWTSASATGIEVSAGSPGMVTGTSGRGIHTVFPTQTLANVGDKLTATYTFTTPATVGSGATGAFRVGLFDTLGRAGLNADISASSGSPNSLYGHFATNTPGLPGLMMDMGIGTGSEDLSFRRHEVAVTATTPTGRLLGTTTGFTLISPTGPDGVYTFAPNTAYTGSLTITRIGATQTEVAGVLGAVYHSVTDGFDSASFGMLAFWANSNVFGSSNTPGVGDNGIDFSNVKIEFTPASASAPVPEPSTFALFAAGTPGLGLLRRRARHAETLRTLLVLAALGLLVERPSLALPIQPPGLQPGQVYHWMFTTRGERDATSADINDYNDFVRSEAALNPSLTGTDVGVQWYAIASTPTVNARDNALVLGPVYLLDGTKFEDDFVDMWTRVLGEIVPAPDINQFGVELPVLGYFYVWTGTGWDGTSAGIQALGAPPPPPPFFGPFRGHLRSTQSSNWLFGDQGNDRNLDFPLYALSSPIKAEFDTTVPEPGGLLLIATGLSCLAVARLRGHRSE